MHRSSVFPIYASLCIIFVCSGLLDGALYSNGCVTARGLKLTALRADILNVIQERAHTLDVSENMYDVCRCCVVQSYQCARCNLQATGAAWLDVLVRQPARSQGVQTPSEACVLIF